MNNLVYLSGPITSCDDSPFDWRREFDLMVDSSVHCLSPKRVPYFQQSCRSTVDQTDSPYAKSMILNNGSAVLRRSYADVQNCDLIVVNLLDAEEKSILGDRDALGTMFELAWAYSQHKPIILIIEEGVKNIHSHSELFAMCTFRVDSFQAAADLVDQFFDI